MSHVQSQPLPPELQLRAVQEQVKSLHQTVGAVVNLFTLLRLHMEGQSEKLHGDANPRMHDPANQVEE